MWATAVEEGLGACEGALPKILKLLEDCRRTSTRQLLRTILMSSTSPPEIFLPIVVLAFNQKETPICDVREGENIVILKIPKLEISVRAMIVYAYSSMTLNF